MSDDAVGRIMTKDQGLYTPPSSQPICHFLDTKERNFIHFQSCSVWLFLIISGVHFHLPPSVNKQHLSSKQTGAVFSVSTASTGTHSELPPSMFTVQRGLLSFTVLLRSYGENLRIINNYYDFTPPDLAWPVVDWPDTGQMCGSICN